MSKTYSFKVKDSKGNDFNLETLKGQAILVVNVASRCGYTPQYTGLNELHKSFKDQGFTVLGFPCNQFGGQEPGTNQEIQEFCSLKFDVQFPIMGKVEVNGDDANPFFKHLKAEAPGLLGTEMIKWNFTKFLIDQQGNVVARFAPQTEPRELEAEVRKLLSSQG